MRKKSIVKMKHGLLIIVPHVPVDQVWSIVRWYNVQHMHIVDICISQKMNVVRNVEVNDAVRKEKQRFFFF